MKKKLILFLVLLLFPVVLMIGCSGSDSDSTSQTDSSGQANEQTSSGLDESLTGADLLSSLSITEPDSLSMTYVTNGLFSTDSTMTSMIQDGNSRIEMDVPDVGKQIIIYNASEGMTYQYIEGQTTGMMFSDSEVISDSSEDLDAEEMTSSLSDFTNDLSGDFTARIEELNGEKVVYIETSEDDGEGGMMQVKMWYSLQYGVPLKYEIYSQDELIASTEVTEISSDTLDSSLFEKPSGIEFTDFSSMDLSDFSEMYSNE